MKRPTPREEIWDRYLRECAPLVRVIALRLRLKAADHDRSDDAGDALAQNELDIADLIEREYLKEES